MVAALLAFVAGAVLVGLMREQEVRYLRRELAIATDRIAHAWKDGAVIAPRPAGPVEPAQPLPAPLRDKVDEWEPGTVSREVTEAKLRRWHFAEGLGVRACLVKLEEENGAGAT